MLQDLFHKLFTDVHLDLSIIPYYVLFLLFTFIVVYIRDRKKSKKSFRNNTKNQKHSHISKTQKFIPSKENKIDELTKVIYKNLSKGEWLVREKFAEYASPKNENKFYFFTNLHFKIKDGNTARQIDHLLVCKHGVFIIETKRWNNTTVIASATYKNSPNDALQSLLHNIDAEDDKERYVSINFDPKSDKEDKIKYYGNPYNQVRETAKIFNKYLEKHSIKIPVNSILCFYKTTNSRIEIIYKNEYLKWTNGLTDLPADILPTIVVQMDEHFNIEHIFKYISSRNNYKQDKHGLSDDKVVSIANFIMKYVYHNDVISSYGKKL